MQPEKSLATPLILLNPRQTMGKLAQAIDCHRQVIAIDWTRAVHSLPPSSTVSGIAAKVVMSIRAARPSGPYLLAGCGAEALLAYEAAVQLQAAGETVAPVVMMNVSMSVTSAALSPLTSLLRSAAVKEARRRLRIAARSYSPSPYSGRAVLLTHENSATAHVAGTQWLAASAMEVVRITGNAREIAASIELVLARQTPPRAEAPRIAV